MSTFTFNGVSSDSFDFLKLNKITTSILPPIETKYLTVPGREGGFYYRQDTGVLKHTIEITIRGYSREAMTEMRRQLAGWLKTDRPAELRFSYEPDKYYMAILDGETDLDEVIGIGTTELVFLSFDPYARGGDGSWEIDPAPVVSEDIDTQAEWESGTLTDLVADSDGMKLAKEGIDYAYNNTSWSGGTPTNLTVQDGTLSLTRSGTDFERDEYTLEDFEGTHLDTHFVPAEPLYEDFNDTNYVFTFTIPAGSNAGWQRVTTDSFTGSGCWASAPMTPTSGQHKYARSEFTVSIPLDATDAFLDLRYRVSSEAGFDFFRIIINGVTKVEESGVIPWTRYTEQLDPGAVYTVRFEYHIDGATSVGDNRAYVDDILVSYLQPSSDVNIAVDGLPDYDFRDSMGAYAENWRGAGTNGVTQNSDYVRVSSNPNGATGLDRQNCVSFPFTMDLYIRSNGGSSFYVSDGSSLFVVPVPNTSGQWSWVRVRCPDNFEAYVYMNGVQVGSPIPSSAYSVNRLLLFYSGATGTLLNNDVSAVYYTQADLGVQDTTPFAGTYTSQEYDLSSVGLIHERGFDAWVESLTSPFTGIAFDFTIEMRTVDYSGSNPVYGAWSEEEVYNPGDDLTDKGVQWRVIMETADPGVSAQFSEDLFVYTSAYYPSGTFVSNPITGVQDVVKARSSLISWASNAPTDTSVSVDVAWDLGSGFGAWLPVTSGGSIPGITISDDLTAASIKFRITLNTSDTDETPTVDSIAFNLAAAWRITGQRISGATDLGVIGDEAAISNITWDVTPNGSHDVIVEVQVTDAGDPPDPGGWVSVSNGDPLPISTGLTNKDLYHRITINGDGTSTPTIHRLVWLAQAPTDNVVPYTGTKETAPTIKITFNGATSSFSILHQETSRRLLFNREFVGGNVLTVNCATGKVLLNNTINAIHSLARSSQWIYLQPGDNTFEIDPLDLVNVDITWEDRYV